MNKYELFTAIDTLIDEWIEQMNVVKLVNKAKKGNKNALVKLVMAEKDAYYRLTYTYMKNEHDSLDALSEMNEIITC